MALQQSTRRQVPNLAKISPPKPPQLGKTQNLIFTLFKQLEPHHYLRLNFTFKTINVIEISKFNRSF